MARRARGALQPTWADDAVLSVWQEKGDGIGNGVRFIVTRQRRQNLRGTQGDHERGPVPVSAQNSGRQEMGGRAWPGSHGRGLGSRA